MYNGALADMGLGSDPFTGNHYAFTGGNPISVEVDGYWFALAIPVVAAVFVAVVVAIVANRATAAEACLTKEYLKKNSHGRQSRHTDGQRRCADAHGEHPMTRTGEDRMDTERGTDE